MEAAIIATSIVAWLACSALAAYLYGLLDFGEGVLDLPVYIVALTGPLACWVLGAIWIFGRGAAARERKP